MKLTILCSIVILLIKNATCSSVLLWLIWLLRSVVFCMIKNNINKMLVYKLYFPTKICLHLLKYKICQKGHLNKKLVILTNTGLSWPLAASLFLAWPFSCSRNENSLLNLRLALIYIVSTRGNITGHNRNTK